MPEGDYPAEWDAIPERKPLPNQGGGERGYVDCALTLGVYHPQAHGIIKGTS